jgi:DNA gyrase/topoisomerase IV subunit B
MAMYISDKLGQYLEQHPKEARNIINKAVVASRAREDTSAAPTARPTRSGGSATDRRGRRWAWPTNTADEPGVAQGRSAGSIPPRTRQRAAQRMPYPGSLHEINCTAGW